MRTLLMADIHGNFAALRAFFRPRRRSPAGASFPLAIR